MNIGAVVGGLCMIFGAAIFFIAIAGQPARVKCTFDRNELGPMGDHGQWYWEIYKCSDGTERRELVASPRG